LGRPGACEVEDLLTLVPRRGAREFLGNPFEVRLLVEPRLRARLLATLFDPRPYGLGRSGALLEFLDEGDERRCAPGARLPERRVGRFGIFLLDDGLERGRPSLPLGKERSIRQELQGVANPSERVLVRSPSQRHVERKV